MLKTILLVVVFCFRLEKFPSQSLILKQKRMRRIVRVASPLVALAMLLGIAWTYQAFYAVGMKGDDLVLYYPKPRGNVFFRYAWIKGIDINEWKKSQRLAVRLNNRESYSTNKIDPDNLPNLERFADQLRKRDNFIDIRIRKYPDNASFLAFYRLFHPIKLMGFLMTLLGWASVFCAQSDKCVRWSTYLTFEWLFGNKYMKYIQQQMVVSGFVFICLGIIFIVCAR